MYTFTTFVRWNVYIGFSFSEKNIEPDRESLVHFVHALSHSLKMRNHLTDRFGGIWGEVQVFSLK